MNNEFVCGLPVQACAGCIYLEYCSSGRDPMILKQIEEDLIKEREEHKDEFN